MAYDLEEQEQLETFKAWWKQHGWLVILAVTVAVVSVAAFQGWRYYQHSRALQAAALYDALKNAERDNNGKRVREIAAQLEGGYASTTYAVAGALASAKAGFDALDLPHAKAQLAWAMEHAKEAEMRDVARLRLAAVLLDEKNYAEALKLLDAKPADSLSSLYADLRGDVLVAQGKLAEARNAYQLALDKSDAKSPYRGVIQLKIDTLGEPK